MVVNRTLLGMVALSLLGVLGTGCGGSGETGALSSNPGQSAPLTNSSFTPVVTGRIFLGAPAGPAQVVAKNLSGQVLATTATTAGGYFNLGPGLPADFRVETTLGSATLATEVRGYRGQGREVVLSVPTTLVSLASRTTSFEEAEVKIRRLLQIPNGTSLEHGIEESGRASFSHFQYFVEASQAGGIQSFNQQLLSSNQPHPFRLSTFSLESPITGLTPELQSLVDRARRNPRLRRSALVRVAAKRSEILAKEVTSLAELGESFSGYILDGVGSSVLDSGLESGWTWLAQSMGLNYGTGTELAEILDDLQAIINALDELKSELTATELQAQITTLESYVNNITTLTNSTFKAGNENGWTFVDPSSPTAVNPLNLTDTPVTQGTQTANLVGLVKGAAIQQDLDNIQDYLLGSAGGLNSVRTALSLLQNNLGVDQPASMGNFPVRSNALIDNGLTLYNRYAGYVTTGTNYLAEQLHFSTSFAKDLAGVVSTIQNYNFKNVEGRHQAPAYLPSDQILVDLENGLMWYTCIFDQDTYGNARSQAANKTITVNNCVLSGWRLPSYNECLALQARGRFVADSSKRNLAIPSYSQNGDGDTGESLWGLAALGFSLTNDDWSAQFGDSAEIWYDRWECILPTKFDQNDTNYEPWTLSDNHFFRLNRANDTDGTSDSKRAFVLVRTIGTTPLLEPGFFIGRTNSYGGTTYATPTTPFPRSWVNSEIQGPEAPGLGVVTGMEQPTKGVDSSGNPTYVVQMKYLVALGGSFKLKQGGASQESSNPAQTYTMNVGSDQVAASGQGGVPALLGTANLRPSNSPNTAGRLTVQNVTATNTVVAGTVNATFYAGYDTDRQAYPVAVVPTGSPASNSTIAASTNLSLNFSDLPGRKLRTVQILPRNQIYQGSGNTTYSYQVVNFFSDFTVEDVSASATVALTDASNQAVSSSLWSYANGSLTLNLTGLSGQTVNLVANVTVPADNLATDSKTQDVTKIKVD